MPLTVESMHQAFNEIERHDLRVNSILVTPQQFSDIRGWGRTAFDSVGSREVIENGIHGSLWGASLYVTNGNNPQQAEYRLTENIRLINNGFPIESPAITKPKKKTYSWNADTMLYGYRWDLID